jgi:hypothetical protein
MTPLSAESVAPSFAPSEEIDGCWLGTLQVSTLVKPAIVVGRDSENFSIIACERSVGEDNFLILATPASIEEVLDMVDSRNAGYEPASLADDACYKQTYKALWDESMATPLPFLRTCANLDEMQSTLLGRIDGLVDSFGGREFNLGVDFALVKPLKASGPIASFMLPSNRSADMFRLGLSTTLSYKTDVAASLQLYEITKQDLPAYDLRFRFGLDTSSTFTDGIASDLIFGREIMEGTDLYDIGAQMILMVEQLMEGYVESQL